MKPRVIAVLLVIEALVVVVATAIDARAAGLIAILATSFATLSAVVAHAFVTKAPLSIASAVCWAAWWILDALVLIWAIRTMLGGDAAQPPSFNIVPLVFAAAAVGLAALSMIAAPPEGRAVMIAAPPEGRAVMIRTQRGGLAMGVLLVGFLIAWCFGELWLMNISIEDADRIQSLRRFGEVGFVGWHVVLALLLWRGQVTNRTASP